MSPDKGYAEKIKIEKMFVMLAKQQQVTDKAVRACKRKLALPLVSMQDKDINEKESGIDEEK